MEISMIDRLRHGWNAFLNKDPTRITSSGAYSGNFRPDRVRFTMGNERSIVSTIYNKIAVDVASISLKHALIDENDRYVSTIRSSLHYALTVEANIDQSGPELIQDIVMSMFDDGCVAVVPVDTTLDPLITGAYEVQTLRTAKILEWFPEHVRVRLYNDRTGMKEDIILPKRTVAIIENPFYAIMNEPNSVASRLIQKINQLDTVDRNASSGRLDVIIQLPYVIKTKARQEQAEERLRSIEEQLEKSKYGIAYTDGTEKVVQLNRSVENTLLEQIEQLQTTLLNQLGMTQSIFDGTADEATVLNYYSRTIEPCLERVCVGMKRKFITKTAQTKGQSIVYIRDPFKLMPVKDLAEMGDKFTRNAILSSNDMRSIIGFEPSSQEIANKLENKNIRQQETATQKEDPPDEQK